MYSCSCYHVVQTRRKCHLHLQPLTLRPDWLFSHAEAERHTFTHNFCYQLKFDKWQRFSKLHGERVADPRMLDIKGPIRCKNSLYRCLITIICVHPSILLSPLFRKCLLTHSVLEVGPLWRHKGHWQPFYISPRLVTLGRYRLRPLGPTLFLTPSKHAAGPTKPPF